MPNFTSLNNLFGLFPTSSKQSNQSSVSSAALVDDPITSPPSSASTFNAEEAAKAFDRSLYGRQTSYQDTVKDMQAAGLSPAAMFSNGAGQSSAISSPSAYADESLKVARSQAISAANVASINADATKYAAKENAQATRYAATLSALSRFVSGNHNSPDIIGRIGFG